MVNKILKKLILVFVAVFLLSCDKDDISLRDNLKMENYITGYMNYDPNLYTPYIPPYPGGFLVQFEYSKYNVVKRKGGFLRVGGNYDGFFEDIVDELSYSKNKIVIEKKSYNPQINRLYNRIRTIELSNEGLMLKKTILELGASGRFDEIDTVTIQYSYDSERLLKSSHKKIFDVSYTAYFPNINGLKYFEDASYYYTSKNLDSIVTIIQNFDEQTGIHKPIRKIVEIFSDYDSASNPTKNLFMFDETFKRSLSENNYGSYANETYYYRDGILDSSPISVYGMSWTYAYDEEGNIRLGL